MKCTIAHERIVLRSRNDLGIGDGEMFVASDPSAIVRHTQNVVYLDDGEVTRRLVLLHVGPKIMLALLIVVSGTMAALLTNDVVESLGPHPRCQRGRSPTPLCPLGRPQIGNRSQGAPQHRPNVSLKTKPLRLSNGFPIYGHGEILD